MMHDNKAYNAIITFDLKGLYFLWLEMPSVCDLQCKKKTPLKKIIWMKIQSIKGFYYVDHPNLNLIPTRPCDAILKKMSKDIRIWNVNHYIKRWNISRKWQLKANVSQENWVLCHVMSIINHFALEHSAFKAKRLKMS